MNVINRRKYNIYLDYIRGLSAIFVVLFHYTARYKCLFTTNIRFEVVFKYGSYGVLAFFLLSGYLTYEKIDSVTPGKFVLGRFLRLYPMYWVCIIITWLSTHFFLEERATTMKDMFVNFTMIQTLLGSSDVDGAYWTLLCELCFYFFIFVLLLTKSQKQIDKILVVWATVQIVLLLAPDVYFIASLKKLNALLYSHCFMVGICLSKLKLELLTKKNRIIFYTLCGVFFTVEQFVQHEIANGIAFVLIIAICAGAVYLNDFTEYSLPGGVLRVLSPISFVASISYPLYLLHQNLGYIILRWLEKIGVTTEFAILIPFIVVMAMAWVLHMTVEKSMLNIRKKILEYRK